MGVFRHVEDDGKRPKNLQNTSVQGQEHSKPMEEENSSEGVQVDPNHLGAKADASAASETIHDIGKKLRKLQKVSELKHERSKRRD